MCSTLVSAHGLKHVMCSALVSDLLMALKNHGFSLIDRGRFKS